MENNIRRMLAINQKNKEKNYLSTRKLEEIFGRKYVNNVLPHIFVFGDIILMLQIKDQRYQKMW